MAYQMNKYTPYKISQQEYEVLRQLYREDQYQFGLLPDKVQWAFSDMDYYRGLDSHELIQEMLSTY